MNQIIVKIEPDKDRYLLWSKGAAGPCLMGTREEIEKELLDDFSPRQVREGEARRQMVRRFQRADEYGCSSGLGDARWGGDGEEGLIYGGEGWLPRRNFVAFADAYEKAQDEATEDGWTFRVPDGLLEPFEDEDEL